MIKLIETKNIRKISLIKDNDWLFKMIEREHHLDSNENRYVDITKKFPHSEIKSSIYKWKTIKHKVTEKIKFDKKE